LAAILETEWDLQFFEKDDMLSPAFIEKNTGDREWYDQTLPNGTKLSKQSGD
jgi:hypothetical protein